MNKANLLNLFEGAIDKLEHFRLAGEFNFRKDIYVDILTAIENLEPTGEEAWKKVGELYGKNQYEAVAIFERGLNSSILYDPTKIYASSGTIFRVNEKIDSERWQGYAGYCYIVKKGEFDDNLNILTGASFDKHAREANKDEILLFKQADACRKQIEKVAELRNAYLQEVGE